MPATDPCDSCDVLEPTAINPDDTLRVLLGELLLPDLLLALTV